MEVEGTWSSKTSVLERRDVGGVRLADSEKVHEVNNYQGAQFGPASLKTVSWEYYTGERK